MKTKTVVTAEVEDVIGFQFGYDLDGMWQAVDVGNPESVERAAKHLGLTEAAVEAIAISIDTTVEHLVTAIKADLKSIWDRV